MKRGLTGALAGLVLLGLSGNAPSQGADQAKPELNIVNEKPKPCVTFARTWDAAVEEGKILNLPIVVHSHGFY